MKKIQLLNYNFTFLDFDDILELIEKDILKKGEFRQIISLNPENLLLMLNNPKFERLVLSTKSLIADGVGIVWASKLLNKTTPTRLPGVELMDKLLSYAVRHRLRCLLIGGGTNLAELTAECYKNRFPRLEIIGLQAVIDVKKPKPEEISHLKQIVRTTKPRLVFVAFGSPAQELWIETNKNLFKGCLVVGVGGSFAMLSGVLPRAPKQWRRLGLEWLYRLIQEPWRIKRQAGLLKFTALVVKAKFKSLMPRS